MAGDKTDKTDTTPAATLVARKPSEDEMQAARDKIEEIFSEKAKQYLSNLENLPFPDYAVTIYSMGIKLRVEDEIRYPVVSNEQMTELLERAQTDSDAYDAALYLARLWMARRMQLPDPLLPFVLDVLAGKCVKPKAGRRRAPDTLLRSFMYAWALFIHQQAPDIPLVRNEHKKRGWADWSTCDLVAHAFSSAGKHTTYQQVKSFCYDPSYWHIRAAASLSWQKGRRYEDTGRDFDFDLDAFCFGKP